MPVEERFGIPPPMKDIIAGAIGDAIEVEVTRAVKEAKLRLDRRVPEVVAGLLFRVMKNVRMETLGPELVIRIRWEDKREGKDVQP